MFFIALPSKSDNSIRFFNYALYLLLLLLLLFIFSYIQLKEIKFGKPTFSLIRLSKWDARLIRYEVGETF